MPSISADEGNGLLAWDEVGEIVLEALTPDERTRGIAYVDRRLLVPGESVHANGREVDIEAPCVMGFIDRDPAANWGHDARYLLVDARDGSVQSFDAQFPPYLRGASPTLRLVWKGPAAPDWAAATRLGLAD